MWADHDPVTWDGSWRKPPRQLFAAEVQWDRAAADNDREQRRNRMVQSGVSRSALASMDSACLRLWGVAVATSAITAGTSCKSANPMAATRSFAAR